MVNHSATIANRFGIAQEDIVSRADFDYRSLSSPESRRGYFQQNGYLVRPGLIDESLCFQAAACFDKEIKSYGGHLYRQASANPEKHEFNAAGKVMNPLLNPLSVNSRRFPLFRAISEKLLSSGKLFGAVEEIYTEPAVLVQSMYFEGNPGTWPHQDGYYLDADTPGQLIGAWIALEDIDARVGRFYILPGSQLADAGSNRGNLSIATNHERYKQHVLEYVRCRLSEIRAPVLKRGDVLFWSSRTIHGASVPVDPNLSRHSYTAHFISASSRFVQYECIPLTVRPAKLGGNDVCRPKDQNRLINRWILALESHTPWLFPRLKKAVVAHKIKRLAVRRAI